MVFGAALVVLSSTGCNKLKARDHLNKGVQAYKNSKFEQAIDDFQQAVALDPTLVNARLYLATAYAQQYIPGADTPENNRFAEQAIDSYKQVLQVDPKNINSIKGIAYLYLQMKKFPLAKEFYKKASEADPNDPEPYYSVAVIDWTQTYVPRQEERAKLGMKPDDSLPAKDKKACAEMKEHNTANVQEGIDNLNKALQLRPDYDDATIRRHLRNIRYLIYHTLSDDLEVIERVADRDEFKANVEREGEDNVIELLRDTAKRESWLDLFESRTSVIYHSSDIKQRSDLSALRYIFQDHPGRH